MVTCAGALATLAGCVVVADDEGGGIFGGGSRTVAYRCDDDRRMTVRYTDNLRRATVDAGDDSYGLSLNSRDGDRRQYQGEEDGNELNLVVDGDRAELSIEDEDDFEDCRARG